MRSLAAQVQTGRTSGWPSSPDRRRQRRVPIFEALVLAGMLLLGAGGARAQLQEEDLDLDEPVIAVEIEDLFRDAVELFGTVDMPSSIPLFEQVISNLEPLAGSGEPAIDQRLRESRVYLARAHHNLGNLEATREVLTRLLEQEPDFEIDRDVAHPELVALFDATRDSMIGFVEFLITPPDSRLRVGSRELAPQAGPQKMLAGSYVAEATRPGYTPASFAFEVEAGGSEVVEGELERSSAAVILRTRPSGATILLNGAEVGQTEGEAEADFVATGEAAAYPRHDFSALAMIDDVPIGSHRLDVTKDGYRPYQGRLTVDAERDIRLLPILLEEEAGTVVLSGLPDDAEVLLDGSPTRVERSSSAPPQLSLEPGSYRLQISQGTSGIFEAAVDVVDRGVVQLDVELRPALTLLGILGEDTVARERVESGFFDALRQLGDWSLLDRSLAASPLLSQLGLEAGVLRSSGPGEASSEIDWRRVQETFDRELPAAVYVLAVLSDDLLAKEVELWIWPSAPGPSRPETRRLAISEDAFARLASAFRPAIGRPLPILGASTLDSALVESPVVVGVAAQSPAAAAGIAVGDRIVAVDGNPVANSSQLEATIAAREPGDEVELSLERSAGATSVSVTLGSSYRVVRLADPEVVYAALSSALEAELQRESEWPRWVLGLNRAAVLMRAREYEQAVRQLNGIDRSTMPALDRPGLGRAHLEYWLGLALTQAGLRYADDAREAFRRAASAPGGRLYSDRGPLVEPRATARLQALGGAP